MNLQKQFVPHELVKGVKEKGFNEPCLASWGLLSYPIDDSGNNYSKTDCLFIEREDQYDSVRMLWIDTENAHFHWHEGVYREGEHSRCEVEISFPAPTHQQCIDWLRDKHKIDITILPVFREKCGYDSFRRDGYTYEITKIEPCVHLGWESFNSCAEDRDEENKDYPKGEGVLKLSNPDYYFVWNKAIEHALTLIP